MLASLTRKPSYYTFVMYVNSVLYWIQLIFLCTWIFYAYAHELLLYTPSSSSPPYAHTHTTHEQLSARVLTLQEQGELDISVGGLDTSGGNLEDKSTEQLWEIIR